VRAGKRVLVAAHGNSLRALVKYLDSISDHAIVGLNIPTGIPLVYELDERMKPLKHYYLGDPTKWRAASPRSRRKGKRRPEGRRFPASRLGCGCSLGASQEENLKALRGRIDAINRELQKKEEATKEARDSLRDSERAISNASRALAHAATEARQVRAEAARIAERRRATEAQIAQREAALERMLVAWSASGAPDALRVVLSGDDPADLGRKLHYLGAISRAAAALIAEQRAALAELERLVGEAGCAPSACARSSRRAAPTRQSPSPSGASASVY
jgi:hypothetical protein